MNDIDGAAYKLQYSIQDKTILDNTTPKVD